MHCTLRALDELSLETYVILDPFISLVFNLSTASRTLTLTHKS